MLIVARVYFVVQYISAQISYPPSICRRRKKREKRRGSTFLMMGSTASVLLDEEDGAARPLGIGKMGVGNAHRVVSPHGWVSSETCPWHA
jgi:hypothetical protein